jgi:hypothetical protein
MQDGEVERERRCNSSTERIVLWSSRLVFPVITYLLGQALYWLWFDSSSTANRLGNVVSGLSLIVVFVPAGISSLLSWCFSET